VTKKRSPSREGRKYAAIDPELIEVMNALARRATVLNKGKLVYQRDVHDALLWHAIKELGHERVAQLALEYVRKYPR
jgi:hypothetical protein